MQLQSAFGSEADQLKATYDEATKRARGEIGYPAPRARVIGNLQGAPIRDKLLRYAPVEDIPMIRNCAMLFVVAEKEELFDNALHGKLAYDRAREPKKYVVIPGIAHYGIYGEARDEANKLAIEWFDPVFIAGHWTPQIVDIAGGIDVLGFAGEHSEQSTWATVAAAVHDAAMEPSNPAR